MLSQDMSEERQNLFKLYLICSGYWTIIQTY